LAGTVLAMGLAILLALAQSGSLAAEQLAADLSEDPHAVNAVLRELSKQGLVDAIEVGEVAGHSANGASYWRLTDEGRSHLARRR
jgi:DNA-binding MarR family transcriptional regulator